jgi:stage IV sporulation protein B
MIYASVGRVKMKKTILTTLCSLVFISCLSVPAYAQELLVGGQVVGIQMSTKGVLVAGLSEVETAQGSETPAQDAGVKQGDIILAADNQAVSKAADVIGAVEASCGQAVTLSLERGGRSLSLTVQPVCSAEGRWMLGMWLRDGISGIGTLTFQDPDSGVYGALGHSINDSDSGTQLPISEGSICDAQVLSVIPGVAGTPGELNGCADLGKVLGTIELNTDYGIFGQSSATVATRVMETGTLCTGPATMLTTVDGRNTGEYDVEINRIYSDSTGRHAMVTITDTELLSKTGGIVQGMSGSPLIQNGKIVGAVTHVFVSNPQCGYAVSIDDMLSAAGIKEAAA